MIFIGKYNKSVILTYVGLLFSILGMIAIFNNNVNNAMICLIFCAICDLFDGKIARKCKRNEVEKEFGKNIDSLVDVVSFLALPVVIGIKLFKDLGFVADIILFTYALSGIIRLAWFDIVSNSNEPVKYFIGVPVAYIALVLPIIYSLELVLDIVNNYVYAIIYFLFSFLFILNIKIAKPKGMWYVIFSFLAILITVIIKVFG